MLLALGGAGLGVASGHADGHGSGSSPPGGHVSDSGRSSVHGSDAGQPVAPGSDSGKPIAPSPPGSDSGHPGGPGSGSGQPIGDGSGSDRTSGGSDRSSGQARGGGTQSGHGRRGIGSGGSGGQGGNARAADGRCESTCRSAGGSSAVPGIPVYTPPSTTPIIVIATPTPTPTPIVSTPAPRPITTPSSEPPSASGPKLVAGSPGDTGAANLLHGLGTAPSISPRVFAQAPANAIQPTEPGIGQAASAGSASPGTTSAHSATEETALRASSHERARAPSINEFQRIERVVPAAVWVALALSLALAAVMGTMALRSGSRMRRQGARLEVISAAALTDPLTGILNRRGFTEAAERELARARRHNRPFTLAYIDVRNLKAVNDTEGHRAGDELLKQTARLLQDAARADDVVGRIGGDEMAMMLVEQDASGAEVVKQRIAERIATRRAEMALRAPWDLTIGTAAYPQDGATVDDLLRTADMRLYEQRGIALG